MGNRIKITALFLIFLLLICAACSEKQDESNTSVNDNTGVSRKGVNYGCKDKKKS